MSVTIEPGSTDVSLAMGLIDPATNGPLVGQAIAELDVTYCRPGAAAVKADATALGAVDAAHADNKAIEIDATNAKGEYRVDWPDAAFAAGVPMVSLIVQDGDGNQVGRLDVTLDPAWATNVDSTGGTPVTAAKALEVALAVLAGIASYNATTGVWTVKGRDGATTVVEITMANYGDRTGSSIP